jgi:hypothetical protein
MAGPPLVQHDPNRVNDPWLQSRIGRVVLEGPPSVTAGALASFTLTYVAGYFGVDDTGGLRIVTRFATDMGRPELVDASAPNYVSAEASNGATLELRYDPKGHVRPWDRTIQIRVLRGFLREGDRITVRLGDPRRGSPGLRMQTFVEDDFQFKVFVDPMATGVYTEVPDVPAIAIVAGPPARFAAVLPTLRRIGQPFRLGIKAEDRWGNPTPPGRAIALRPSAPIAGLPARVELAAGERAISIEGLSAAEPGDLTIDLLDERGELLATSNPLRIVTEAERVPCWGDLHGQSEETIGTRPADAYYRFARDLAFCDVVGHQGNDFQITRAFYDGLNELSRRYHEPGRFITLPGYEWSGNTGVGGDRNVYFAEETSALYRSSHALVPDQSDLASDCSDARELFERLRGHDAVVVAHVGGRYADLRVAHDGKIERAVEIHSAWGTFEWLLHDALDLGLRVGVVSNSDDHKGRPGASWPGASAFGAYGGLTCLLVPELSRAAVLDALRRRRHYGTTGNRMHLDVRLELDGEGEIFDEDPALGPTTSRRARQAVMGDIVRAPDAEVTLAVVALASGPIERVEVRRGREVVATLRPHDVAPTSRRLRVVWEGAEVRGRGRQTIWDGDAELTDNRITAARAINFKNPDKPLHQDGASRLSWSALTTGNFGGFDVWLAEPRAGRLRVTTPVATLDVAIDDVGVEPTWIEAGGVGRRLGVSRLPEIMTEHALDASIRLARAPAGDSAFWVHLVQEDGFVAWSSPIYLVI